MRQRLVSRSSAGVKSTLRSGGMMTLRQNLSRSIIALVLAIICNSAATAQYYEAGSWRVTGYRFGSDGSRFTFSPPPQACGGGSNYGEHIVIPADAPNRQEIIASLMSAYFSGEKVSGIWFSNAGPCNEQTAISVTMIRMGTK